MNKFAYSYRIMKRSYYSKYSFCYYGILGQLINKVYVISWSMFRSNTSFVHCFKVLGKTTKIFDSSSSSTGTRVELLLECMLTLTQFQLKQETSSN